MRLKGTDFTYTHASMSPYTRHCTLYINGSGCTSLIARHRHTDTDTDTDTDADTDADTSTGTCICICTLGRCTAKLHLENDSRKTYLVFDVTSSRARHRTHFVHMHGYMEEEQHTTCAHVVNCAVTFYYYYLVVMRGVVECKNCVTSHTQYIYIYIYLYIYTHTYIITFSLSAV